MATSPGGIIVRGSSANVLLEGNHIERSDVGVHVNYTTTLGGVVLRNNVEPDGESSPSNLREGTPLPPLSACHEQPLLCGFRISRCRRTPPSCATRGRVEARRETRAALWQACHRTTRPSHSRKSRSPSAQSRATSKLEFCGKTTENSCKVHISSPGGSSDKSLGKSVARTCVLLYTRRRCSQTNATIRSFIGIIAARRGVQSREKNKNKNVSCSLKVYS